MASIHKKQDAVRLVQSEIKGEVLRREIHDDEDMYLVEWIDVNGNKQQRFFSFEELETVT